jgi:hypothetical protein
MRNLLYILLCVAFWSLAITVDAEESGKYLKSVSDEELIKLTAAIYNTRPKDWEDEIARKVALDKLIRTARKMRSPKIDKSGILNYKYERVFIKKWPVGKLRNLYGSLRKKQKEIDWETFSYLLPREKALLLSREITIETVCGLIMPKATTREPFRGSWWQ